jgi:hypothetical protein
MQAPCTEKHSTAVHAQTQQGTAEHHSEQDITGLAAQHNSSTCGGTLTVNPQPLLHMDGCFTVAAQQGASNSIAQIWRASWQVEHNQSHTTGGFCSHGLMMIS